MVLNQEEEDFYGCCDHREMGPPGGVRCTSGREGEQVGKVGESQVIQVLECLILGICIFPSNQ